MTPSFLYSILLLILKGLRIESFSTAFLRQCRLSKFIGGNERPAIEEFEIIRQPTEERIRNAPVLISIGPPCADKKYAVESFLDSLGHVVVETNDNEETYREINLRDNSVGVYHRIPLAAFIYPATHLTETVANEILYEGVTVRDRLFDPNFERTDTEIKSVILRLAGRITPDDFASRIRDQASKAGDNVEYFKRRRREIAEDLISAVEEVAAEAVGEILVQMHLTQDRAIAAVEDELPYEHTTETTLDLESIQNATSAHVMSARALIKTPHVDLFVPQAIFNGGIDRSEEVLENLLVEESAQVPMIWGNTNTRPSEYEAALSAAERSERPVKFVVWGTPWLPKVSRKELLKRNVARFRSTGRYIPAGALGGALDRVETLLQMAKAQARRFSSDLPDELIMDAAFANLGGYEMQEDGYVVKTGECKPLQPPFRRQSRRRRRPNPASKL